MRSFYAKPSYSNVASEKRQADNQGIVKGERERDLDVKKKNCLKHKGNRTKFVLRSTGRPDNT